MNLQDKLHERVYVPTSVETLPENDGAFCLIKNDELYITTYDKGIGFGLSGGNRKWLKPSPEPSYLLTPLELLEMKKQWASEVWDDVVINSQGNYSDAPEKETYINSLTL